MASGEAMMIVYFLPIKWSDAAANMLPKNAPLGGVEPVFLKKKKDFSENPIAFTLNDSSKKVQENAKIHKKMQKLARIYCTRVHLEYKINLLAHDAISLVGKSSGSFSWMDGTAGAE